MITVIGCGRLGCAVADHYLRQGDRVRGLIRNQNRVAYLEDRGIIPLCADLDTVPVPDLRDSERLFYFAPPPDRDRSDPRIRRLLASLSPLGHRQRILYISTTGVYGDCQGEWVDETRVPAPLADRARRRLDAEHALRDWSAATGGELIILRVAGIYGPSRLPIERLKKGSPLVRASEAPYTNRIHEQDLIRICIAAMERAPSGSVYNVSDGHPGTMVEYFNRVAELAGLPLPPTVSLAEAERYVSPGMLSYMRESRRLDNRKLIEELGIELQYPTLNEGLGACFRAT